MIPRSNVSCELQISASSSAFSFIFSVEKLGSMLVGNVSCISSCRSERGEKMGIYSHKSKRQARMKSLAAITGMVGSTVQALAIGDSTG